MGFKFWREVGEEDELFTRVQKIAEQEEVSPFLVQLENIHVRRGFWKFFLDQNNFAKWPTESKKALFQQAWYEGFMTINYYPQAIAITFAATSVSLFALSFITGASLTLFTCIMASVLICGASYMMENQENEDKNTQEYSQIRHEHHSAQTPLKQAVEEEDSDSDEDDSIFSRLIGTSGM